MTTISVLFLGTADDQLIKRLQTEGYVVDYRAAEHSDIWRKHAAQKSSTGYQMTKHMLELVAEARRGTYDFVVVTTSPEFALKLAHKLPRPMRPGVLFAFKGMLSAEMRTELRKLGCRNFTSPGGLSITDWILP